MKIIEVTNRTPDLVDALVTVWEGSVRATHLFLSDAEIKSIKEYVPQALTGIAHLIIAEEDEKGPVAFMGVQDGSLEMLFIAPKERGKGLGKKTHSIRNERVWRRTASCQRTKSTGKRIL